MYTDGYKGACSSSTTTQGGQPSTTPKPQQLETTTRVKRSTTTTSTETSVYVRPAVTRSPPVLPPYHHHKKPKFTRVDNIPQYDEPIDRIHTQVCDHRDAAPSLTEKDFKRMTEKTKTSFIRKNCGSLNPNHMYIVSNNLRLFAYLYDNCSVDLQTRLQIADMVNKDVESRE